MRAAPDLRAEALALDQADELRDFRARFALPRDAGGAELAYLCGHSLGLAPLAARARVLEELEDWERLGVHGHEHGRRAWIGYAERLAPMLAGLAGAQPVEVVAMNSLTVNLHLLLASFYRPTRTRYRIMIESGAFPSDRYLVASQIRWHGLDPAAVLIEVAPRPGEELLRMEDIDARIGAAGESLALVLWPGVQYRTGQAFGIAQIVGSAHSNGAMVGFDLAHAIGNLPLALHDSGADFAAWCSYKYLNAGPGAIGGAFVHARHGHDAALPRLAGWWGSNPATRFAMGSEFELTPGAAGWQLSNPPVLSAAPLFASLELFAGAGMTRLRAKSCTLTAFLLEALRDHCGDALEIITPAAVDQRGAQLSVRVLGGSERARRVFAALERRGVVADWREPDTIRLAPVPLYNSYMDAWRAAAELAAAIRSPAPAAP
jgi:kynureninase